MQMFVYQFCEIAQMVEYNSNGLVQFLQIIKKAYVYLITKGKEVVIWLFTATRENSKRSIQAIRKVFTDYFIKTEEQLTKDELRLQILWT